MSILSPSSDRANENSLSSSAYTVCLSAVRAASLSLTAPLLPCAQSPHSRLPVGDKTT